MELKQIQQKTLSDLATCNLRGKEGKNHQSGQNSQNEMRFCYRNEKAK